MRQPSHAHHSMPECQQLCSQDQSSWQRSSSSRRSCWHPNSSRRTRLWAVLICLHTLQAAAIAAAADAAAGAPRPPCVACDDCVTSSCLRVCLPSCKTEPAMAAGSPLTAEQCKHKGQEAAAELATEACKQSQALCQVGSKPPARFASVGTVSASQCAALANAGCQKMASSPTFSSCGANQYFGYRFCTGRQFSDIYRIKVGELCLTVMQAPGSGG